jgi:hypothetical protein
MTQQELLLPNLFAFALIRYVDPVEIRDMI